MTNKNNIRNSIIEWNNRFPFDRWWREKYKVPFGSSLHKESIFFYQYFEYIEDKEFERLVENSENQDEVMNEGYKPLSGNWWIGTPSSQTEIDDWFKS